MKSVEEYILGLKEPLTLTEMKKLVGKTVNVRVTNMAWGKEELHVDIIKITNIKCQINIPTDEINFSSFHIYGDYFLKGVKKYNAWQSLSSLQKRIKRYYSYGEPK